MENLLKRLGVEDKNFYRLSNATKMETHRTVMTEILKRTKEGQKEGKNYVVVFVFAGHGIQMDGTQYLLCNEYDPKLKFYKMYPAEKMLRHVAEKNDNVYFITFFACCR